MQKQIVKKLGWSAGLAFVAAQANAAAPDFSTLTSSADFSSVSTAVLTVAAAVATVYVVMRGARAVLGFIRR